jgi:uncharacterized membrane protein
MTQAALERAEGGAFRTTRHWIAALSGLGAINMAIIATRQLGIVRRLPDPPIAGFDSNRVIVSRPAYALGVPDAPIGAASMLANIPLALIGGDDRARTRSWLPIAIAAKAIVEVSVAGWYLVQMRAQIHAWCAYCLLGAAVAATVAGLALPEASAALSHRGPRIGAAVGAMMIAAVVMGTMSYLDSRHRK